MLIKKKLMEKYRQFDAKKLKLMKVTSKLC